MADVFGRTTVFGDAMAADATKLTFTQFSSAGLIIQNVTIGYNQTVTRLYALEDGKVYFVAGRTDGQMDLQHVIGPAGLQQAFFREFGNVCNVKDKILALTLQAGCNESTNKAAVKVGTPVITSLNLQVNSNDMIIGSGLRMMFTSLDLSGGGN